MTKNQRFQAIILISIALISHAGAQTVSGSDLHAWVRGIEGKDPKGRREYIKKELNALGIRYATFPFSKELRFQQRSLKVEGENIVVSFGKGGRKIVVGAHLDASPGSPGANDNGGSVAVVLGLIRAMKDFDWKHRVDFCFFDQEELGLVGSEEFVRTYADTALHLAMINLDVNGMGDVVYVGPVGGGDDDVIMPLARTSALSEKIAFREHKHYPPSDYLSFADRKLENISVSVVPAGDVDLLADAVANGWQIDPARVPEVMKYMHTANDRSDRVTPDALALSFRFTGRLLRLLNDVR
jgi:hypothetical protein